MNRPIHLLALTLLAFVPAPDAAARTLGSLDFEACSLSAPMAALNVSAQCTTLSVPENPDEPGGRQIDLALAWVPSPNTAAAEDPVFMLAGGPGQSALQSYPTLHQAFAEVRKNRHVILVDQRGTGDSNPLLCRDESGENTVAEEAMEMDAESLRAFAEKCLSDLQNQADPRFYTTTHAVRDLESVRQAIGVERINLLGISYGTRVAQQYLRRHPEHVRSVVLDGVAPNPLALGADHSKNLEAALALQFERCGGDSFCAERFGSPRSTLDQLMRELRAAPVPVRYQDPLTGKWREEEMTAEHVATIARFYAYIPMLASMLPLVLHEAVEGRPEVLMAQARMMTADLSAQITHGMQLSILCSEDEPRLRVDPADEQSVLGTQLITLQQAQCQVWPRGDVPADFHAPIESDTPVLLISGEFDPVTPPRYGDEVVEGLPNGRHLVLRGQGHNVIGAGCMPRLFGEFVEKTDAAALDVECLDGLTYTPPFAGFYGWEP